MVTTIKQRWADYSQTPLMRLVIASASSFVRTNCSQLAAGVALFAMLSLLPLLIVMVSLLPGLVQWVFPHYDVHQAILHTAQVTVSPVARRWLEEVLTPLSHNNLAVDTLSLLTFAWGAANIFGQLDSAFNQIAGDREAGDNDLSIRRVMADQIRQRRNAVLLFVLALAGFISAHLIGLLSLSVQRRLSVGPESPGVVVGMAVVSWLLSALFLALLYRGWMASRVTWRACILGAGIAAGANHLVRLLVTNFIDTTIGASYIHIGGPLALMLGVFLIIQNILIGAIIARQYMLIAAPAGDPP